MNLEIGSTVGDYEVVGILGAGGMGQVYKVRNVISDRVEAMKVLLPDLANQPELADRFLREIKVQASLEHPSRLCGWPWRASSSDFNSGLEIFTVGLGSTAG